MGEVVRDFTILFKGRKVTNVEMELSALGPAYMVGGSVKIPKEIPDFSMGSWQQLDLEDDILAVAERNR
jgi:4'-phosphopantetheinyl transferase